MRHTLLPLSVVVVFLTAAQFSLAQNGNSNVSSTFEQSSAELTMVPGTIKPIKGKFPDSLPFILELKQCDTSATPKRSFQDISGLKPTDFDVQVLTSGITVADGANVTDCQITGQLRIDTTLMAAGHAVVIVTRKATASSAARYMGRAEMTVLDIASAPVPGDAAVDASWSVMGDAMCKKNFGAGVARSTYCIEVKVGNNSGYPLQLAGIGFRRQHGAFDPDINVNLSYRSVRASLQNDANFGRAAVVSALDGTGLLMAGATPFFHASYSQTRYTAFTALIGTLLPNAVAKVWPDTDQQKMNNLDDEAFRDNLLIPNNTQVRTTVFIDRTVMDGIGQQYAREVCSGQPKANTAKAQAQQQQTVNDEHAQSGFTDCPSFDKKHRISDPNLVKMALGRLVIVGNLMSYMQRVVVDPAALAAAQETTRTGFLSDPHISADAKTITVTVPTGTKVPTQIFLTLLDLKNPIEYDLNPPTQTGGTVTYTVKDASKSLATGVYEIVDGGNQLLTNVGVTLQVVVPPASSHNP